MQNIPITVPQCFRIIAHRGASAYAPENTRPAFELARRMEVREVELDTQLTTDGVVVLCHDDSLDRYGNGDHVVEEMCSAELRSLDMGSWFSPFLFANTPMLTLGSLLDDFGNDFVFHIELKGVAADLPAAVFALVEERNMLDHLIVTSFSFDHLQRMRQISSCRLGWLVHEFSQEVLDRAAELDLLQLCPPARTVTRDLVEVGHRVAEEVRAWGVGGTPKEVRLLTCKIIESGCDGMTTNWPDWATHQGNRLFGMVRTEAGDPQGES